MTRLKVTRFDGVSIGLHWATVLLIAAVFTSALSLGLVTDSDQAGQVLTLHRSLGVMLWALALVRVVWRLTMARHPPLPEITPRAQIVAARITELGLYSLMLAQPVTGLIQSVARGRGFRLFFFETPRLMAHDKATAQLFHQIHTFAAWVFLALIAVHIAAALVHRFIRRDGVLRSMLPWPQRTAPRE